MKQPPSSTPGVLGLCAVPVLRRVGACNVWCACIPSAQVRALPGFPVCKVKVVFNWFLNVENLYNGENHETQNQGQSELYCAAEAPLFNGFFSLGLLFCPRGSISLPNHPETLGGRACFLRYRWN